MKPTAINALTFVVAGVVGVTVTLLVNALPIPTPEVPSYPSNSEVTEISYEVIYDACSGSPKCPSYKLTIERGETTLSRVTKSTSNDTVMRGVLSRGEFDQLARMLEAQRFFDLGGGYPVNTGCADCVIKIITVVGARYSKRVVHLAVGEDIPVSLWTIERAIEGTTAEIHWQKLTTKDSRVVF